MDYYYDFLPCDSRPCVLQTSSSFQLYSTTEQLVPLECSHLLLVIVPIHLFGELVSTFSSPTQLVFRTKMEPRCLPGDKAHWLAISSIAPLRVCQSISKPLAFIL